MCAFLSPPNRFLAPHHCSFVRRSCPLFHGLFHSADFIGQPCRPIVSQLSGLFVCLVARLKGVSAES